MNQGRKSEKLKSLYLPLHVGEFLPPCRSVAATRLILVLCQLNNGSPFIGRIMLHVSEH